MVDWNLETFHLPLNINQSLIASGVGAITFPVILGITQVAVFKPLKVSTRLPLALAATFGGLSVTLSSLLASSAVIKSYSLSGLLLSPSANERSSSPTVVSLRVKDLLVSTGISVLLYRGLGGRFSSAVPSHLFAPGAFAAQWIPARSTGYANESQRHLVQQLGRRYGCHTCGTRNTSKFIADHQPPSATIGSATGGAQDNGMLQKFYPQCQKCSVQQGSCLSVANPNTNVIVPHQFSLRLHHLFIPIPLGIALFKYFSLPSEENVVVINNFIPTTTVESATPSIVAPPPTTAVKQHLSELVTSFPVLIVWNKIMSFIDSFHPLDGFHLTLWGFSIIAALGTIRS